MLSKIVLLFLVAIAVMAMFGRLRLRWPIRRDGYGRERTPRAGGRAEADSGAAAGETRSARGVGAGLAGRRPGKCPHCGAYLIGVRQDRDECPCRGAGSEGRGA